MALSNSPCGLSLKSLAARAKEVSQITASVKPSETAASESLRTCCMYWKYFEQVSNCINED